MKTPKTIKFLCIGVADSKMAGRCPGADVDAKNMYDAISNASLPEGCEITYGRLMLSKEATVKSVTAELTNVCNQDENGLAIVFYAGHGGSERTKQNAPEEIDGKDEFILLYDSYMLDDKIWNIVSTAPCRVFLMFDCCHSETMFRFAGNILNITEKNKIKKFLKNVLYKLHLIFSPQNPIFAYLKSKFAGKKREAYFLNQNPAFPELLCWSGCADDKVSVGNSSGGLFTSTILKYFYGSNGNTSYDDLWKAIASDERLRAREISKCTLLKNKQDPENSFSGSRRIFN